MTPNEAYEAMELMINSIPEKIGKSKIGFVLSKDFAQALTDYAIINYKNKIEKPFVQHGDVFLWKNTLCQVR